MRLLPNRMAAAVALAGCALATTAAFAGTKSENGVEVRDWQAIDSNRDGAMSPEEIEKFLQETWAKTKGK